MRKLIHNGSRKLSPLVIIGVVKASSVGHFAVSGVNGDELMMKMNEACRYI